MKTDTEPLRFEGKYVTDADYPRRLALAFLSFTLSKPRTWLPFGFTLVVAVVIGSEVRGFQSTRMQSDWVASFAPFAVLLVVLAFLALAFGMWRTYVRNRRRFTASIPAGSLLTIGFRDTTIASKGPQGNSEVNYSVYQSVEARGNFVFLRQRGIRLYGALPAEMFSTESLAWLRSKIAK